MFHFTFTNCLIVLAGQDNEILTFALIFFFLVDNKKTTEFLSSSQTFLMCQERWK